MNENLDLTKILKDVPSGTKLYSPICGECEFLKIVNDEDVSHPIICRTNLNSGDFGRESFSVDGKFSTLYKNAECVLFPSKENRDWSTFKVPKKHKEFKPFQKVLWVDYRNLNHKVWAAGFYSHYDESIMRHSLVGGFIKEDNDILPYEGNEDKLGKYVE